MLYTDGTSASSVGGAWWGMGLDESRHGRVSFQDALGRLAAVEEMSVDWRDEFGDGALTGWTVSGQVAETGGVLRLTGSANTYAYRPNVRGDGQGVVFDFKYEPGAGYMAPFLDSGTWG